MPMPMRCFDQNATRSSAMPGKAEGESASRVAADVSLWTLLLGHVRVRAGTARDSGEGE